jgi:hypothetical protein
MRIIVCGSRSWADPWQIRDRLARLPTGSVVVYGDSAGPETIAGNLTFQLRLQPEKHVPNREVHGTSAGRVRNRHVALLGADLCLVFWDGTPGEADLVNMLDEAIQAGIPTEVVTRPDVEDVVVAGEIHSLIAKGFRVQD